MISKRRSTIFTICNIKNHQCQQIRSLMAIVNSLLIGQKDPFMLSSKGFQILSSGKVSYTAYSTSIDGYGSGGKYPFANGSSLRLWGCCSANDNNFTSSDGKYMNKDSTGVTRRRADYSNGNNFTSSNDKYMNGFHRVQAVAPALPLHLVKEAEDVRIKVEDSNGSASNHIDTKSNSSQRGSNVGFADHNLQEKIAVAVDVDEVLGNFVSALNKFIADRYSLHLSVSEYHVYEFFKIWNCSRDEADIRVHEFFKTNYFKAGIHPLPGSQQALQKMSRFCNLSIVTSRQNAIKDHTLEWIERHYPGMFQDIHFGNHFALNGKSIPKSDICRSLGAKVLIDDNPRYAIECADAGIKVLLFDYENSYPWSKSESLNGHPLVRRVHNWEEVEHQLASWIIPKNSVPQ